MGVVLLILKILGITILCVLGLVLLILALVLFVPIRYRVKGNIESKEHHSGVVCVHWLLHAIDIRIIDDPETRTVTKRLRILGLFGKKGDAVIFPKAKEEEEESDGEPADGTEVAALSTAEGKDKEKDKEKDREKDKEKEENRKEKDGKKGKKDRKKEKGKKKDKDKDDGMTDADHAEDSGDGAAPEGKKKRSLGDRIDDLKDTVSCVLELFSKRRELLKNYLTKKSTKAAIGKLWKTVVWLLKTIAPRKGHAEVTFGLKDPELTGKAFAAAAMLYPWYGKHIDLYPEFSGETINGHGDVKGRIRLWGVAIRALSILFDKNIKKVRKEFAKVKETMMNTPSDIKKIIKKEDAA